MVTTKIYKLILCFTLALMLFLPNPTYAEQNNLSESEILYQSALDYYNKGQYDLAITNNTKAIELNPQSAFAYYNRGNSCKVQAKYDLAVPDLQERLN